MAVRKPVILALISMLVLAVPASPAGKRRAVRHPGSANPPVATNDSYTGAQDTNLTVPAPGVLANDTLNQATLLSYGATTGTEQTTVGGATATLQGGTVTLQSTGGFLYAPKSEFKGNDSFRYTLAGSDGSATALVTIAVTPTPPTATADAFTTSTNTTLNVSAPGLLVNDSLNGATLVSYGATAGTEQATLGATTPTAANGSVVVNANGSFAYTPLASLVGTDTFKYVVQNAGGSATATATITVQAPSADFTVTSPGFFYFFSGLSGQNPVLTLKRGRTYIFEINTDAFHPFEILNAPPGSVTNNNISQGTITFAVPSNAASYRYNCSIHDFGNTINTIP